MWAIHEKFALGDKEAEALLQQAEQEMKQAGGSSRATNKLDQRLTVALQFPRADPADPAQLIH